MIMRYVPCVAEVAHYVVDVGRGMFVGAGSIGHEQYHRHKPWHDVAAGFEKVSESPQGLNQE